MMYAQFQILNYTNLFNKKRRLYTMWTESIVLMSSMLETIFNSELCVVEEKGNANEWRTGEGRNVTSHRH